MCPRLASHAPWIQPRWQGWRRFFHTWPWLAYSGGLGSHPENCDAPGDMQSAGPRADFEVEVISSSAEDEDQDEGVTAVTADDVDDGVGSEGEEDLLRKGRLCVGWGGRAAAGSLEYHKRMDELGVPDGPSTAKALANWLTDLLKRMLDGEEGSKHRARLENLYQHGFTMLSDYSGKQCPELSLRMLSRALQHLRGGLRWLTRVGQQAAKSEAAQDCEAD